jgi:hypothetical protein
MTRQASIHIKEDDFKKLLIKHFFPNYDDKSPISIDHIEFDKTIRLFMYEAKKLSPDSRRITITNQKLANKVINKVVDNKTDIHKLSSIIYYVRKQLKHKGIKPLDQNSNEWASLKKLVIVINQFCVDFDIDKKIGYTEYIKIGLSKISSFRGYITKLYDMSESISNEYQAIKDIEDDENKKLTRKLHDLYFDNIYKITGLPDDYLKNPTKYSIFTQLSKMVKDLNITPEDFIESQFRGLDWANTYPEPSQLISENSIKRLNKFMFNKNNKKKVVVNSNNKLKETLNNIKNGNYRNK